MATQMREHILGVASDLFSNRGINATSVDTIVAEAGIAKVTLYKYFKSKEQLILEYLKQYDEKLWQKLALRTNNAEAAPRERIKTLVHAVMDWIEDPEFKGFAFVKASVEFPEAGNPVHQSSVEFAKTLRNTIAGIASEVGIKSADALALQLSMVIEGAAITENMQRASGAVAHARELANILIDNAK